MISSPPRGATFLRSVIAAARASKGGDAAEIARNTYGDRVAALTRAAVGAGSTTSDGWGAVLATPENADFLAAVQEQSILGKLAGLRVVPLNTRLLSVASGTSAYWVGRGSPKPLSKASIAGSTLPPLKVAGLFAVTEELVRHNGPKAEALMRNDLIRAIAEELDRAFIDAANAGIADEMPASVTNGVTPIASSGNPSTDVVALIAEFAGDLISASFVTDPQSAAEMAMARDTTGGFLFTDVGVRGGALLGLPFIVSRVSPRDSSGGQLTLVDASSIAYGAEGIRVSVSQQTSLAMQDSPESPAEVVSLFQTNTQAVVAEAVVNWEVQRAGSVSIVTGCNYPTEAGS